MEYHDLRTWLKRVEQLGELRVIRGAHWNPEIGVLAEFLMRGRNEPVALFDSITDYPPGFRVLVNDVGSRKRLALTLGLPIDLNERGLMDAWRKARKKIQPTSHKIVQDGPVLENVLKGEEIDMWKFPTPQWHEEDGEDWCQACVIAICLAQRFRPIANSDG